jgi:predicted hotdog family 3-hydroxylacyl-ACP dehydratase
MYSVAMQMKDTPELAAAITMTFTIAPLLLLNSHSKSARMAAFIPIAIEIMSNTVGYFGGLLRLTIGSDEIRPGRFLHLVSNMFGTEYRPTALFLAIIFAASIAALSIISAHSIAKKA